MLGESASRVRAALQRGADRCRARGAPRRGWRARARAAALGAGPRALGREALGASADQRAGGVAREPARVRRVVSRAALPDPGRRLLRVAAGRERQDAVLDHACATASSSPSRASGRRCRRGRPATPGRCSTAARSSPAAPNELIQPDPRPHAGDPRPGAARRAGSTPSASEADLLAMLRAARRPSCSRSREVADLVNDVRNDGARADRAARPRLSCSRRRCGPRRRAEARRRRPRASGSWSTAASASCSSPYSGRLAGTSSGPAV